MQGRCPTPFGIRGGITRRRILRDLAVRHVPNAFRHQRRDHSCGRSVRGQPPPCPTPFGIRGGITLVAADPDPDRKEVPNAFRHQRRDHTLSTVLPSAAKRSVPNAFRHQRRDHVYQVINSCRSSCAQRLSASEAGSRDLSQRGRRPPLVPNAFRHQRRDHGCRSRRAPPGSRAQRLSASEAGSRKHGAKLGWNVRVPNAFRHQRRDHDIRATLHDAAEECPTPFGIRGGITASEIASIRDAHTCPTPFGIRGGITPRQRRCGGAGRCAQRLSASEAGSLALVAPGGPKPHFHAPARLPWRTSPLQIAQSPGPSATPPVLERPYRRSGPLPSASYTMRQPPTRC